MIEVGLISVVLILCVLMIYIVRSSRVKNLEDYINKNHSDIVSDPGDEIEHIYNKKNIK
jgi:hypothetical protein